MLGIQWAEKLGAKASRHPMSDPAAAAKLLQELPFENPAKAVAEAAAWLESVEAETSFGRAHRVQLVSLIDQAARASVDELALAYAGVGHRAPGQSADWRALTGYLDRLSAAYREAIESAADERSTSLGASLPAVLCRMTRAIAYGMKLCWMRYLPPERASWEAIVQAFRTAQAHNCAETLVMADPGDTERTCVLHEFSVAAMFAAATPESLNPRRVELVYRITTSCRAAFDTGFGKQDGRRHYHMNLDQPGPPARTPEQLTGSEAWMFFHANEVQARLRKMLEGSRSGAAPIPDGAFGAEFAPTEKEHAIEHVLRFWDDSPPSRREPRMRINTKIQVELGVQAVRDALEGAEARLKPESGLQLSIEPLGGAPAQAAKSSEPAALIAWTLTDYSARGLGVRCARRLDRWVKIGSVIGVRLERSEKWCVAIVRRLRTDARSQTDVGAELLTKSAELVTLEGPSSAGASSRLNAGGPIVRSRTLMLPEDPQGNVRASLLFEPNTNAPEQTFVLRRQDGSSRRIRLHESHEVLDGWERVEFDWLEQ